MEGSQDKAILDTTTDTTILKILAWLWLAGKGEEGNDFPYFFSTIIVRKMGELTEMGKA